MNTTFVAVLKQLFTPLSYLKIRNELKLYFDIIIPALLTAAAIAILSLAPLPIKVFGNNGLIHSVTELMQLLVGFYIAALSAVAAFSSKDMDNHLQDTTLARRINGKPVENAGISRRQFLCYMFGYLAFMGFTLYFFGALANALKENAVHLIPMQYSHWAKWGFVTIYTLATFNALVTTLLGLHFLTDRIHRE